ncbi:ATP-dependent DNA helicase [Streptomyces sp. B1866]|uniref:ATP-dependent helicase n=1 Tax=Streptomyces sp. B1866 TaxID=3075431 RepID=UPI00288D875E|nr:ATP-dependent DNA helicase [Streptomyces sp. B1866]MDT3396971.1 ATP-dependent DNA helicase [Streptomyces sp. B1866]
MTSSSLPHQRQVRQPSSRRPPSGGYRLVRTRPEPEAPPVLDASQRAVVEHGGGPLLVLAGPGTGKTTTLVEAVWRRIRDGADPERILVLTFSRKAAVDLRDRMAARARAGDAPAGRAPDAPAGPPARAGDRDDTAGPPARAGTQQHPVAGPPARAGAPAPGPGPGVRHGAGVPQATTFHSFCYALLRAHQDADLFADPLRLLSGPEQDVAVRDLLAGQADLERAGRAAVRWPDELRACLTTRGFADEVRAVLARSRELGLGPDELDRFARRGGRPDWGAAAAFLAEYLDVLDSRGVLDYAELVHRAAALAERPEAAAELAGAYDAVFVDEYQDTDPAQVRLLRALAGGGRTLVAFGDPDQSIHAFRGADVGGILGFPAAFPRRDGRPAPVRVLTTCRRSGAALLAATREIARRLPLTRLPAGAVRAHREPAAVRAGGRVEVYTFPTAAAELESVADILRRAHLERGVPWSEMAVLVRAGGRTIPGARRALTAAGVPVEVDGDDVPLRAEPAVAPLLTALRVAATAVAAGMSAVLDAETARDLLTSPLGGMDAADLRHLGRALREEERAAGRPVPRPSDVLAAEALAEPERLVAHDPAYARGAQRLGPLLRKTRELLAGGGTAEEALWELWNGTPWPGRLERAAHRGGAAGRNADRDLDAVCALFETAARAEERGGGRGALNFLDELQAEDIAADTLARRAARPDAVRLMTAHRAKGLQWRLVVVAGVQEGLWPDPRRRGSLLEADRIGRDGLAEPLPPGALLAEERRLFYVAATRACERLVVTAVKAAAEDGDQPSRFLSELGVAPVDVAHRPRRPLSVAALVAELRATTVDPAASPALRDAAARRLARLAALADDDGHPLAPAAHPYRWWGMYEPTHSAVPLRDHDRPVALSGSALDQLVNTCPLQWFLGREVRAGEPSTAAQGFGNVVHVLADEVASGRTPADLAVLMERLDSVWNALAFDAPWKSRQEKDNARAALERFLRWHVMDRGGRRCVGTEAEFDVTLETDAYQVRVRGSMDRVEADRQGRAYVVDFKTGRAPVTRGEVERHPQLAVYQMAVREGAVDGLFGGRRPEPGGAELVQLRQGAARADGGDTLPKVQAQAPLGTGDGAGGGDGDAGGWVGDLLATAAGRVLDERFAPRTGEHCGRCAFRGACSARAEGRHVVD